MSFANEAARAAWERRFIKGIPNEVLRTGNRKLTQLHSAKTLEDLRSPPGNRLEALAGDRRGQHSMRINDPWRVCFVWKNGHAYDVEIVDYH